MTSWLHEERLQAVLAVVLESDAARVLDLGCGDGDLFVRLAVQPQISHLTGIDIDQASLDRLTLRLARLDAGTCRIETRLASMTAPDPRLGGYDCAVLVETIEHLHPAELSALERAVFQGMRPRCVVVTTPNAEFNPLLGVPAHRFRHPGHRFEWPRARFRQWAQGLAARAGYGATCHDIGGKHPDLGGASQMAVFRISDKSPAAML